MTDSLWITGASGFSGRYLVEYLARLSDRPRLVGLDVASGQPGALDAAHQVDLTDVAAIAALAAADPPRWVIHLAGAMPPADEETMWRSNVAGTAGLLLGLGQVGASDIRVVGIGSAAEYQLRSTEPIPETTPPGAASAYGRIKWAQSMLTLGANGQPGLTTLVARPFNLFGPGLPSRLVIGRICSQVAAMGPDEHIVLGNTKSTRDFIDIRDAVEAYWLLAQRGRGGEIYNVCSGHDVSIDNVLSIFRELTQKRIEVDVDPARLRADDPPRVVGDAAKIHNETGWRPAVALRQSLADMLDAVGVRADSSGSDR